MCINGFCDQCPSGWKVALDTLDDDVKYNNKTY